MALTHEELGEALNISRARVTQLVALGMPTDSIEEARAWRDKRRSDNERAGHIAIPVKPLNLNDLNSILNSVSESTGDDEMDERIRQQIELCEMTRQVFENSIREGDPSQSKLYGNYDKSVATLLRLERERHIRLQERGRLVDSDEACARFGKILSQLRALIERAELTVAPESNPDNPQKALKAFRKFKDDLFKKIHEYNPRVELTGSVKELPKLDEIEDDEDGDDDDDVDVDKPNGLGINDIKFEDVDGGDLSIDET